MLGTTVSNLVLVKRQQNIVFLNTILTNITAKYHTILTNITANLNNVVIFLVLFVLVNVAHLLKNIVISPETAFTLYTVITHQEQHSHYTP